MKKIPIFGLILMLFSIVSCNHFDSEDQENFVNEMVLEKFTVKETTNSIGVFSRFQLEKIEVDKNDNWINFQFFGEDIIKLTTGEYPVSSLKYKLIDGKLFLNEFSSDFLLLTGKEPRIISDGKSYYLEDGNPFPQKGNIDMLILGYMELTTPLENRMNSSNSNAFLRVTGCSWLNTYHLTSVNVSRSSALFELDEAILSGEYNSGCTMIGEVDVSCVLDAHLCFATATYCCDLP